MFISQPEVPQILPTAQLKGHLKGVECICYNPKKDTELISGSHDTTLKIWDITTRKCLTTVEAHKEGVWTCDYALDGNVFLTGSPDKLLKIWDSKKLKTPIKTFIGHGSHIYCAKYNETNTQIASGGADSNILIWDLKKGDIAKKIAIEGQIVYGVDWSKCGNYLVACDFDGRVYLYDAKTFSLICKTDKLEAKAHGIALDFSEKSRYKNNIFVAYSDNSYRKFFYDKKLNKLNVENEIRGHFDSVKSISLSSKRGLVCTGCKDGTAKVWNGDNQSLMALLVSGNESISSISFGQGDAIAVGSWDQDIRIFKYADK